MKISKKIILFSSLVIILVCLALALVISKRANDLNRENVNVLQELKVYSSTQEDDGDSVTMYGRVIVVFSDSSIINRWDSFKVHFEAGDYSFDNDSSLNVILKRCMDEKRIGI